PRRPSDLVVIALMGRSGASFCTATTTADWSGPGSSTSSTTRAGSRVRTASSTPMPSLTGLTVRPSERRARSTEAEAAVGGSASRTWLAVGGNVFGGTDTRVDAAVDVYEDAPPGGAAGSIG